jgi:thiosulfate/3-mercaptopyruvate sulfurtransferase
MSTAAAVLVSLDLAGPSGLLVSPTQLASSLADPATVVIHVEEGDGDFVAAHVPGARVIRLDAITVDGAGLRVELPPIEDLRRVFEAAGVGPRSSVVLYGSAMPVARAFFTLDYLGHPNVRLLNGGLTAWRAERRPVQSGDAAPAAGAGGLARLSPRLDAVAYAEWLVARLESPQLALVDARPDAEFTGSDGGMNGMHPAGHLAGARQLVWTDLVSRDGQLRPDDELRAKLEGAGAKAGVPVVSYCMVGMRASVVYFVARHLGFDAKMYDGSIVDWGRRKLPVRSGRP